METLSRIEYGWVMFMMALCIVGVVIGSRYLKTLYVIISVNVFVSVMLAYSGFLGWPVVMYLLWISQISFYIYSKRRKEIVSHVVMAVSSKEDMDRIEFED